MKEMEKITDNQIKEIVSYYKKFLDDHPEMRRICRNLIKFMSEKESLEKSIGKRAFKSALTDQLCMTETKISAMESFPKLPNLIGKLYGMLMELSCNLIGPTPRKYSPLALAQNPSFIHGVICTDSSNAITFSAINADITSPTIFGDLYVSKDLVFGFNLVGINQTNNQNFDYSFFSRNYKFEEQILSAIIKIHNGRKYNSVKINNGIMRCNAIPINIFDYVEYSDHGYVRILLSSEFKKEN